MTESKKVNSEISLEELNEANLGRPFYVEHVTPTAIRVVDVNGTPRLEVSYTGSATLNGISVTDFGTYQEQRSEKGSFYSEGRGVIRADNSETATYISHTVGHSTAAGKWIDHGTLIFRAPTDCKLSFLNNLIAVFKDEAPKGTSSLVKVWKWE
jgi:hypothetical protein